MTGSLAASFKISMILTEPCDFAIFPVMKVAHRTDSRGIRHVILKPGVKVNMSHEPKLGNLNSTKEQREEQRIRLGIQNLRNDS